jgi:hypothetical protein
MREGDREGERLAIYRGAFAPKNVEMNSDGEKDKNQRGLNVTETK